ncbi:unnamed protein product [Urochloa humidicola]
MAQIWDAIFVLVELVLVAFFFIACLSSACLRRSEGGGGGARANGGQQQGRQPRAPLPAAAPAASAPPLLPLYAARNEERLRAPVVLPHFPYPARPREAAAETCAICLDELRQG